MRKRIDLDKRLKAEDPRVLSMFRQHCEDGWSPSSFAPFLFKGDNTYRFLKNTNPEFKSIVDKYKKGANFTIIGEAVRQMRSKNEPTG